MKHPYIAIIFTILSTVLSPMAGQALADTNTTLTYGETKRPDTLDPYTSREPSSLRLSQLMFNGLVLINDGRKLKLI
ncbi:MAG: hypothetical protein OEX07_08870 [Gammaproteobacteria bacterium]|nr:hypothetical protein [Gammaproteobacteria bacterium]